MPATANTPMGTPTPMPALVPVLRALWSVALVDVDVDVDVGVGVDFGGLEEGGWAGDAVGLAGVAVGLVGVAAAAGAAPGTVRMIE